MKVIKTYKYQLRPSKEKETVFYQTLGVCRLIYNLCLEYRQMMYKDHQKSVGKTALQKEVKELAKEYDWIKSVHSQVRQNAVHRLIRTYDNFFKQGAGFPKFAKRGLYKSFTYPQGVKMNEHYIYLPKIGWIKYYQNQELPEDAVLKTTTVSKEADAWHVSVTFETSQSITYPFDDSQVIGIDVGVKYYYVDSKGQFVNNPSFLKDFSNKIKKLNRKLSRQIRGSNRREKTKISLQKTYLKLRRKRSDFTHKLTTNIVRENSIIIVEDLKLKNMTKSAKGDSENHGSRVKQKSGLNRVLLDLAAGEFYRQLEYKSEWQGRRLVKVNPAYTSQTCPICEHKSKENRKSQSTFCCINCGHTDNADHNAAKNIKRKGLSCNRQRKPLGYALVAKPTL